jgi:hypothetical protein
MNTLADRSATQQTPESATVSPLLRGTMIGRGTALFFTLAFLPLLAVPAVLQLLSGSDLPSTLVADYRQYGLQKMLNRVERHLVFDSEFSQVVRPPYQGLLLHTLRQGSTIVLVGTDEWLHLDADYDLSTHPGVFAPDHPAPTEEDLRPDADAFEVFLQKGVRWLSRRPEKPREAPSVPLDALTVMNDFRDKLRRRDIHLLVVIVPAKTAIYPEKLWPAYRLEAGPAVPDGYAEWKGRLAARDLDVLDLTEPFWQARYKDGNLLYLLSDSHWSPQGVALASELIAERIRPRLGDYRPLPFEGRSRTLDVPLDLVERLGLTPVGQKPPSLAVPVTELWREGQVAPPAGDAASVLLFGDSQADYYEWAEHPDRNYRAGLASQLSLRLRTDVQAFARPGGRTSLISTTLFARPEILSSKKVVVWELAARTVTHRGPFLLIEVP